MNMKWIRTLVASLAVGFSSAPAMADTQAFANCLIDSLNGKERKELVKWIFFSISVHPDLKPFSTLDDATALSQDKITADLISRLFIQNCPAEANAAQKEDPMAVQKAFELVGQVAMMEIMNNQDVITAISNYANYVDQAKINHILTSQ